MVATLSVIETERAAIFLKTNTIKRDYIVLMAGAVVMANDGYSSVYYRRVEWPFLLFSFISGCFFREFQTKRLGMAATIPLFIGVGQRPGRKSWKGPTEQKNYQKIKMKGGRSCGNWKGS
ncbi:hypothetical protein [Oscillibacter sp. PC13]|uniref:hypothetical protein n=1 Tax=Oscillibacter sp. PC13 TaxID=1855299 RepID=UPI0011600FC0|nr:hypothetical protein [Oscillibacter sp. PC13]